MDTKKLTFWTAFKSRDVLKAFGADALLLFALELKFDIEDIEMVASNSLTEGGGDKKADLVYIDSELGHAVIAQSYISKDMSKKEAKANKASDLNTAVSWLISSPIADLPIGLKSHAEELRRAIEDGEIKYLHIWYVHNLPESENVKNELINVEHTANAAIESSFPDCGEIEIRALEVGIYTIGDWYESRLHSILVPDEFTIPISGGFSIAEADWTSYVTSVPAKWLYDIFKRYEDKLFSADVRGYLGSRDVDSNINNRIKQTAQDDPKHFWVFNNGITCLVHEFKPEKSNGQNAIWFKGISIVNGAQTTGAIGSLKAPPNDDAMIQVRFIKCNRSQTLQDIVRFNNSQNKINAPDFRSTDPIQTRLTDEFKVIPNVEYQSRRGGFEDVIRRSKNVLPSVIAGQALAAFHQDPAVAYHQRTHMWEDNQLYSKYFNEHTTAKNIVFAYSLLKAVERKKVDLVRKSKTNSLIGIEEDHLNFFRKRGSTFLMASAIASCLEIFLSKKSPIYLGWLSKATPLQTKLLTNGLLLLMLQVHLLRLWRTVLQMELRIVMQ